MIHLPKAKPTKEFFLQCPFNSVPSNVVMGGDPNGDVTLQESMDFLIGKPFSVLLAHGGKYPLPIGAKIRLKKKEPMRYGGFQWRVTLP